MNILSSQLWPSDMPDDRRVIALLGLVQILEEGMDNLELAMECGAYVDEYELYDNGESYDSDNSISFATQGQLNDFASRLTAYKDAEIARLTEELNEEARLNGMGGEREADLLGKVERLNAIVAIQAEALDGLVEDSGKVRRKIMSCGHMWPCGCSKNKALMALSATAETVSAYENEVKAKALEEAADYFETVNDQFTNPDRCIERTLLQMASELRAKGE